MQGQGYAWLYRVVSSSSQCLGTSAKPVFRNSRLYKSMVYKREKSEELGIAVVPLSYFVHIACYAALTRNASQLCLLTKTVEISTLAVLKVHFFSSLLRMLFACHTLIGAVETMPVKY